MEEDIQNYSSIFMFRGTSCTYTESALDKRFAEYFYLFFPVRVINLILYSCDFFIYFLLGQRQYAIYHWMKRPNSVTRECRNEL